MNLALSYSRRSAQKVALRCRSAARVVLQLFSPPGPSSSQISSLGFYLSRVSQQPSNYHVAYIMAPRRAGGYGSGGYSLCAGLFTSYWDQVSLGYSIVFIIIYIGISIALCCVRKRDNQGRKLIGLAYVAALFSTLL